MDQQDAWEHCLERAALTDVGLRRANNQDSMAVVVASSPEKLERRGHLFVVADGMGAHAAGELASKLATDVIPQSYHKLGEQPPPEALAAAIRDANDRIHQRGMANEEFKGMGTTVTALVVLPEGALLGQVGDSRGYRVRGNRIEQLTFDHSLVWEMRAAGQIPEDDVPSYIPRNIITRSLGPNAQVDVDIEGPFPLQPGDTFLLCSDGLSGQVRDDEIGKILSCMSPQEAVQALVDLANLRGGPDNITVIVVRITGPQTANGDQKQADAPHRSPPKPVSTTAWILMGFFGVATVFLAAMQLVIPAVISAVATAVVGGIAFFRRYGSVPEFHYDGKPLGKAPYTSSNATPDAAFADRLAKLAQQLRDAASNEDWQIDWSGFNAHSEKALAAARATDYVEAVRQYCQAVSFMMGELRVQRGRERKNSDSSVIDLF
ncbi:MAG: serine/threonine-protein phosphatase [Rhodopirellula sp.]|nr:serine/threonine-protein phosphatase [Rhodopirellula sp.]